MSDLKSLDRSVAMADAALKDHADVWIALPCAYCGASPGANCKTVRGNWRRGGQGAVYSVGNYHAARYNARVLQLQQEAANSAAV